MNDNARPEIYVLQNHRLRMISPPWRMASSIFHARSGSDFQTHHHVLHLNHGAHLQIPAQDHRVEQFGLSHLRTLGVASIA